MDTLNPDTNILDTKTAVETLSGDLKVNDTLLDNVEDSAALQVELHELKSQLEILKTQSEQSQARRIQSELLRQMEALPLQVPAEQLLPIIRPALDEQYQLSFNEQDMLVMLPKNSESVSFSAADGLVKLLEPLRMLRKSQGHSQGQQLNNTTSTEASSAVRYPMQALAEAQEHLKAMQLSKNGV